MHSITLFFLFSFLGSNPKGRQNEINALEAKKRKKEGRRYGVYYPREVFGAPKYYVMKAIWGIGIEQKEQVFGSGTKKELGEAILRFRANECFWNNLGRHAYSVYLDWINR